MRELLLGDEAVGLAAIHSGITGAFSYPGTPATEIMEFIQRRSRDDRALSACWSANEKVAYEEALGMSFVGKRALVAMKHVGLNVAADPFMSSALTGARGGLVIAVADDPGMHSSQNEQDSRYYGDFASVPMFEPSNQQEAYDVTREAFELSERYGLPVLIRLVTRLAHSRARVEPSAAQEKTTVDRPFEHRAWTLLPVNARVRYRRLLDEQPRLRDYAEHSAFNTIDLRGPKGIIACGIAHNYVLEVLGSESSYSLMKVSSYPSPTKMIREMIDHCDEILVVEEGFPYLETQINGALGLPGMVIRGKRSGALPMDGEMTPEKIRTALGLPVPEGAEKPWALPGRPPRLCDGCPHCDTFAALLEAVEEFESPKLLSDIGCYTLGALPPYNAVQSCVDMGASIPMAHGAAKGGAYPVVCTIGDSTFIHSGMTGLIGAAKSDADMTVIILDNATVGMTGGQEIFATGDDLIRLVRALGVSEDHIVPIEPTPKRHAANTEALRREIRHRGLSVVIATRPCIQTARSKPGKTEAKNQPAISTV